MTIQKTLKHSPDAVALVFFTPYRPWLLPKDLAFFDVAREKGFRVEKIFEKVMTEVMFEEDPGVCNAVCEASSDLIASLGRAAAAYGFRL